MKGLERGLCGLGMDGVYKGVCFLTFLWSIHSFIFHFSLLLFPIIFLTELYRFKTMLGSLLMFCHLKIWWIRKNRGIIYVFLFETFPPFELITGTLLHLTLFVCLTCDTCNIVNLLMLRHWFCRCPSDSLSWDLPLVKLNC